MSLLVHASRSPLRAPRSDSSATVSNRGQRNRHTQQPVALASLAVLANQSDPLPNAECSCHLFSPAAFRPSFGADRNIPRCDVHINAKDLEPLCLHKSATKPLCTLHINAKRLPLQECVKFQAGAETEAQKRSPRRRPPGGPRDPRMVCNPLIPRADRGPVLVCSALQSGTGV